MAQEPGDGAGVAYADAGAAEHQDDAPPKITLADTPGLLMPWVLFTVVVLPSALARETTLGNVALAVCAVLALGFLWLSRGRSWQLLSFTCLVSACLGGLVGGYDRYRYLAGYQFYTRSPAYENVLPNTNPGSLRDAGYLDFSRDSFVDATRGVGYQAGELWCAAPIVSHTEPSSYGYWAVGTNCCKGRGLFQCGDVWNLTQHGGLVVFDTSSIQKAELPMFQRAVVVASKVYNLPIPDQPIFVRWGETVGAVAEDLWGSALNFVLIAITCFLVVIPIYIATVGMFGLALAEPKASAQWHPDKVQLMSFGIEFEPQLWTRDTKLDLLCHRCYWSGQVLYDYAFHFANKHMFLGVFLSHPAHPYTKWRRSIVCLLVCLLVLWPAAAFSERFGNTGLARTLLILTLATAPLNLLKLCLSQFEHQEEHEPHARKGAWKVPSRATLAEGGFFFACAVVVATVCILCSESIRQSTTQPLGSVLGRSLDSLGYAFIVEPLVDLVVPLYGQGKLEGVWTLGFFGRWRQERDEVEGEGRGIEKNRGGKRRLQTVWTPADQAVLGLPPRAPRGRGR